MSGRFARGYGYYNSLRLDRPVARGGRALPWYTYPAIEFLDQLDLSDAFVFEYGAGHSTLFWSVRARRVISVEQDPAWHDQLAQRINVDAANVTLKLCEDIRDYAHTIAEYADPFDVIVIDGADRLRCAELAPTHLRPGGLIVLDNSDGYLPVAETLREQGFVQIDFAGFGPQNTIAWRTSIFVRGVLDLPRKADVLLDSNEPIPYQNDVRADFRHVYLSQKGDRSIR